MKEKVNSHRIANIILFVLMILIGIVLIEPSYSNDGLHTSLKEDNFKFYIYPYVLGLINVNELTIWVMGVDRRFILMKAIHENELIKASEIADRTGRSLQNISQAMKELEEQGLVKCINPEKHTWKRFILTQKGLQVFEKLKKNHLIE